MNGETTYDLLGSLNAFFILCACTTNTYRLLLARLQVSFIMLD